ncbi:MAG: ornithine carbamoyltransferase [FCB group bacterium]|jgi:ornithine carbamoyltransferase|nr:ornithine carbamoyltransferase [FCB group bacterium]
MLYDFVSLADCTSDEIYELLELSDAVKKMQREGKVYRPLDGQSLAMIFEKPSLRTRVTFETGIFQLGGHGVVMGGDGSRLGERESVADVARNLDRWVDGIMARTFSHKAVLDLAKHAAIPVINALTDEEHPCQVLADAQTLREHKGDFQNLKLAFVGDGNNVAASWLQFCAKVPLNFTLVCPEGYETPKELTEAVKRDAKGTIEITHSLEEGMKDADAVYTDVWASMGQESEQIERERIFKPYQVNARAMAMAKPDAVFMHCLPAKRGKEVTGDVMDCPHSVVFDGAENRLHAQKAIMVKLMQRDAQGLSPKRRLCAG